MAGPRYHCEQGHWHLSYAAWADCNAAYRTLIQSLKTHYELECEGHPAGPGDPMGVTVYCDGTCLP